MRETILQNPNHIERWDLQRLSELGCFLEGLRLGRGGNILPMGTSTIDSLYKAIRTLNAIVNDPKLNPIGFLDDKNVPCEKCGRVDNPTPGKKDTP